MLAAATASGAAVAHCPVSNTLLGSGIMPLDEIAARGIPYAICTDVGASPTTSLLCEMLQFLRVHCGRSALATPEEALFRVTLAPAQILGLADSIGSFEPGKDFSFIEVAGPAPRPGLRSDQAILENLLESEERDLRRYAPDGELGSIVDQLRSGGLPIGPELARLTDDVARTAERLDEKVLRVTLAGREVWRRPLGRACEDDLVRLGKPDPEPSSTPAATIGYTRCPAVQVWRACVCGISSFCMSTGAAMKSVAGRSSSRCPSFSARRSA